MGGNTDMDMSLLDSLLASWQPQLGRDYQAYRNHCARVCSFGLALAERETQAGADTAELLQIALAFHDLGIWSHATFDYLDPSAGLAREWLQEKGRADKVELVEAMIVQHHKLSRAPAVSGSELPDIVRRADLIDVSLGLIRFGLPRAFYKEVRERYPICGFHGRLVSFTLQWWWRHPLRPLPMMRR